jgi:hypothetical protein
LSTSGGSAPTAMFDLLYSKMKRDIQDNPDLFVREAPDMQYFEKQISFLNRYFVFQKVRDLSQSSLKNMQTTITEVEDLDKLAEAEKEDAKEDAKTGNLKKIRKVKSDRVVLNYKNVSPIVEDLVFDDPEIQTFYNNLPQKTKRKIALIPETNFYVKQLWKKKNEDK